MGNQGFAVLDGPGKSEGSHTCGRRWYAHLHKIGVRVPPPLYPFTYPMTLNHKSLRHYN